MSAPCAARCVCLACRTARIVALATQADQSPNAYGIKPEDSAGYLYDRLAPTEKRHVARALDAAGVSL